MLWCTLATPNPNPNPNPNPALTLTRCARITSSAAMHGSCHLVTTPLGARASCHPRPRVVVASRPRLGGPPHPNPDLGQLSLSLTLALTLTLCPDQVGHLTARENPVDHAL